VIDREDGDPVEQTFAAAHFRQQHHAEQEQINVRAFADGFERQVNGQEPERDQQ
jgi:hypothetical protein